LLLGVSRVAPRPATCWVSSCPRQAAIAGSVVADFAVRPSRGSALERQGIRRTAMAASEPTIVIDPFAARSFVEPGARPEGRAIIEFDKAEFQARVNAFYEARLAAGEDPLKPGYAPFCKHLFMPNFVPGLLDSIVPVTEENAALLKSAYVARTEKELPVLARWFPKGAVADAVPEAKFLDIILYSREQIRKENAAMGEDSGSDAPWGIVAVKPQGVDSEIPMEPITMMRNALGEEHGGSGVALDPEEYRKSTDFWDKHARVQ